MTTQTARHKLEQLKGQRTQLEKQVREQIMLIRTHKEEQKYIEQAQAILQKVAQSTQQELEFHISGIVSLALSTVFPDPYELKVEFVKKRGRTECNLLFCRYGECVRPIIASGGGAVDVASFALRVALWSLSVNRSRNVLILDEPLKNLSGDLQDKAGVMVKKISQKLGLQIIMVSHVPDLIENADKVFTVTMKKGLSSVY